MKCVSYFFNPFFFFSSLNSLIKKYAKDKAIIITKVLSHKDMIMCHLEYKKRMKTFFLENMKYLKNICNLALFIPKQTQC